MSLSKKGRLVGGLNKFHSNKHHIIPTSRGGPKNGWNKRRVNKGFHADLHTLFANLLPEEMILLIQQSWTDERGLLKEEILGHDQLTAWYRLFGATETFAAVGIISREWDLTPQEKTLWEERKKERKARIAPFVQRLRNEYKRRHGA